MGLACIAKQKKLKKTLKNIFTNYASPFFIFAGIFLLLHCVNLCTAGDRKQKRTYNILFTLLKRGDENNTVRSVSVSVHDIYSSAFYLALCFFVSILSPFPSPLRHSVSLAERESHSAYKQVVLGHAATAGKDASR